MSTGRLTPAPSRIEGRAAGGWVVGGRLYPPALLIGAASVVSLPGLVLATLDATALPEIAGVDLLLLGTGKIFLRPPAAFITSARSRGWRVEAMDSPAAARTFNVLAGEERLIAALILSWRNCRTNAALAFRHHRKDQPCQRSRPATEPGFM